MRCDIEEASEPSTEAGIFIFRVQFCFLSSFYYNKKYNISQINS